MQINANSKHYGGVSSMIYEIYKNIDYYLPIYGINEETIDIRYFNYNKIVQL